MIKDFNFSAYDIDEMYMFEYHAYCKLAENWYSEQEQKNKELARR